MDMSLVSAAITAIGAAKDIGKAALAQRDAHLLGAQASKLNDLLLQAQEALFAHNTQLLVLQQQHFEATQKLRELEEALAQRGRYTLVELRQGQFAYRVNVTPEPGGAGDERRAEPEHYICQSCLDHRRESRKVVLQRKYPRGRTPILHCPACNASLACPVTG